MLKTTKETEGIETKLKDPHIMKNDYTNLEKGHKKCF